jgi:hypothetical protein
MTPSDTNVRFHQNLFSGFRDEMYGQTDRQAGRQDLNIMSPFTALHAMLLLLC